MKRTIFVAFVVIAVGALSIPCQAQIQPASVYSVKFVCGLTSTPVNPSTLPSEPPVKPGNYATAINVHNYHTFDVALCKKAVLAPPEACLTAPNTPGCFPPGNFTGPVPLHPDQAFEVDCNDIVNLLKPSLPVGAALPPFIKGFVEIVVGPNSNLPPINPLSVTGVYTAQGCAPFPLPSANVPFPLPSARSECFPAGVAEEVVPENSFKGEVPRFCNFG